MLALLEQVADASLPWKELGTGGAALLISGLLVWVVRMQQQQHKDSSETATKIADRFASTVEKQATAFAQACHDQQSLFSETTTKLVEDARESHERRETQLYDLVRELRGLPPR